jgi:hypothetical protein
MSGVSCRVLGSIFLALGLSFVPLGHHGLPEFPSAQAGQVGPEVEGPSLDDVHRAQGRVDNMLASVRATLARAGVPSGGGGGGEADIPAITALLYIQKGLVRLHDTLDQAAKDFSTPAYTADVAQACNLAGSVLMSARKGKIIARIPIAVNVHPADFDGLLTESQGVRDDLKCA